MSNVIFIGRKFGQMHLVARWWWANHAADVHWCNEWYISSVICEVSSVKPLLSGEPDYFGRNEISSGGDLSHYSSASLY